MQGIRQRTIGDKILLYKEAMRLRQLHGWGKRRIANAIGVSEDTVKGWLYYGYSTVNNINNIEIKPSYELGYIIGTEKGDGYTIFDKTKGARGAYMIALICKDIEFIDEFNRCCCKLLNKNKPYAIFKQGSKHGCRVSCKPLYDFLRLPLEEQKPIIEGSKESIIGFLRAFFDGEGGVYYRNKQTKIYPKIRCYNTDIEILQYIKGILSDKFDIDGTIRCLYKDGYIGNDGIVRKAYYQYEIIKSQSILNFNQIGFIISRKQYRLEEITSGISIRSTSL